MSEDPKTAPVAGETPPKNHDPVSPPEKRSATAETLSEARPETAPEAPSETNPKEPSGTAAEATSETSSEAPSAAPEATPEVLSEGTPEAAAEATSEMSSEAPSAAPEATPEVLSEGTPEAASEAMPETSPKEPPADPASTAQRGLNFLASSAPLWICLFWFLASLPLLWGRSTSGLYDISLRLGEDLHALAGLEPSGIHLTTPHSLVVSLLDRIPDLLAPLREQGGFFSTLVPLDGTLTAFLLGTLLLPLLVWLMALVCGYGKRTAFAASCAFLIFLALAGFPLSAGHQLLAGCALTLALVILCSGWTRPFAPFRLVLGFACTALATLLAGLPGLILPLVGSILYLFWRGTFRRAGARDGALGFAILLVLILIPVAWLALWDSPSPVDPQAPYGRAILLPFLDKFFIEPITHAWTTAGSSWWLIFPCLAVLWLPFTLLFPFLPWERSHHSAKAFFTNRNQEPGHGWVWICLICALLLASLLGTEAPILILAVLVPLSILAGQGIMALAPRRGKSFFACMSLMALLLSIVFFLGATYPSVIGDSLPEAFSSLLALSPENQEAFLELTAQGGVCLFFAILLWRFRTFPARRLLSLTALAACLTLPLLWHPVTSLSTDEPAPQEFPADKPGDAAALPGENDVPPAPTLQGEPEETKPAEPATPAVNEALPAPLPSEAAPLPDGGNSETPDSGQEADQAAPTLPEALPAPEEQVEGSTSATPENPVPPAEAGEEPAEAAAPEASTAEPAPADTPAAAPGESTESTGPASSDADAAPEAPAAEPASPAPADAGDAPEASAAESAEPAASAAEPEAAPAEANPPAAGSDARN